MNPGTDIATLVRQAHDGEAKAFEELVRRHFRAAFSVALAILGNPPDAEDVAQDSFVAAFAHLSTCRDPERFAGWLMQIVRNRALNARTSERVADAASARLSNVARVEAIPPEHAGLRERLVRALGLVSPVQREVVLLHDLDGWTHAEIARETGMSEVMSRQHLFQARKTLRSALADDEGWEMANARIR